MGRQGDKNKKKLLKEVKENIPEYNASPVADQNKDHQKGSVFSGANFFLMILTVIVAIIVTSVIVKTVELQQLNAEQDQAIRIMKAEAENSKQQLQNLLSESIEKAQSDDVLINTLQSANEDLNAKIEDLDLQFKNKVKKVDKYHETELHLQKVIEKKEEEIVSLNQNTNLKIKSFETEKKTILEKLETTEQENAILQEKYDLDLNIIKSENEEAIKELKIAISKKDEEILIKSKTIESLEGESKTLFDEKSELLQSIESLKMENNQLSVELVTKYETVESLGEHNTKLSNDLVAFRDETRQVIESIEEEKIICITESETSKETLIKEISKIEESFKALEEEKRTFETTMEENIFSLSSEHTNQLDMLENSKGQLMVVLETEKQEKNSLLEEKTSLANALEDLQLEMNQVIQDLKETQTKQDICNNEKLLGSKQMEDFENKILVISQEKSEIESENKGIAEKLSQIESEKIQEIKQMEEFKKTIGVLSQEKSKLESEYKNIAENLAKLLSAKKELNKPLEK